MKVNLFENTKHKLKIQVGLKSIFNYRDKRLRDDIPWQNQLEDGEEALEYSTYPDQIKEIKEDIDHRYNQDYFVFNQEAGWYCEHIRFGMAPGLSFLSQVAN